MTTNKRFSIRTISKAVSLASLAFMFGTQSTIALQALSADELASVSGQDGITIELTLKEDGATNNDVQSIKADHIVYTADNHSLYLSDVKLGGTDQWGVAGNGKEVSIAADLDVGTGVHNGVSQAVIGLKAGWGDITNLDNRLRLVADLKIGANEDANNVGRLIYEGAGEVLLQTSGLNAPYATEYTNGYIKLANNNIFLLNPTQLEGTHSGFGLRDLDANLIFRTGTFNTLAKDGSTTSFDYQSHFGISDGVGADGITGLFLESNRLQFDVDFVLSHIGNLSAADYELYRGQGLRTQQQDFFGVKFTGEIPNTVVKIGANSEADANEGLFVLFQATFDDNQYDLQLPSLALYQPNALQSDGSNYYTTGENNEKALRLDNFRQFHTLDQFVDSSGVTRTKPAIYLPITIDTTERTLGGDTYDSLRLTINDPGGNGNLNDNIGLEGGIVDLYIEDLNIGTLDAPGNAMGGLVISLNKINGVIDLLPAQTIQLLNGSVDPLDQEGAQLAFVADLSFADSGIGIIQESSGGNQSRIFAGIRDLDLDIAAQGWLGTSNDGLRLQTRLKATTNDFQIGIATAYDDPDQIHLNSSFGNIGDPFDEEDVLLTTRLYLNTDIDATVKPTDDGFANVDATVSFIGDTNQFDASTDPGASNQNLLYIVDAGDPNAADQSEEGFAWGLSNIQGAFRTVHTDSNGDVTEEALVGIKGDSVNHKADGTTETVDSLNINLPFEIVTSSQGINNLQGDFDVQFYGASEKTTLFNYYVPQGFQGRLNVEVWGQNN